MRILKCYEVVHNCISLLAMIGRIRDAIPSGNSDKEDSNFGAVVLFKSDIESLNKSLNRICF